MYLEDDEIAVWCIQCDSYCYAISFYEVPRFKEAEALNSKMIGIQCPYPKKQQFDPVRNMLIDVCDTKNSGRYGRS